jgi:hypothetical protein
MAPVVGPLTTCILPNDASRPAEVPPRRQVCPAHRTNEPAVPHDVPLAAPLAAAEYDLRRESARMRHADPLQGRGHRRPGPRLRAKPGGVVAHLGHIDTVADAEKHLARGQDGPAPGTRDVLGAAVGQEQVAAGVDHERGGNQAVGAGTLAGAAEPGEEVRGGGDPRARRAAGGPGKDLGRADVAAELGHVPSACGFSLASVSPIAGHPNPLSYATRWLAFTMSGRKSSLPNTTFSRCGSS